ncbi:MAG: major facilitator, partial [Prolixibacteraceae bacterium]
LLVYIIFNKFLPTVGKVVKAENKDGAKTNTMSFLLAAGLMLTTSVIFYFLMNDVALGAAVGLFVGFVAMMLQISTKEERPRVSSLILVFFVVIFFWMSFHQNGLTMTFFARDYTVKEVAPFTYLFFSLYPLLSFIGAVAGIVLLFNKAKTLKLAGVAMTLVFGALVWFFMSGFESSNPIAPEVFQSFNPLFIVALTFPVMGVFTWLRSKNMEPSTPRKIGIGMVIAAVGFVVILVGSIGLVSPHELQFIENGVTKYNPVPDSSRVVPYWLISSYLVLTIAELFLSPMGLSFVSKVAPPRFQGLMQGGWLLATAVGNKFLFVGSDFWGKLDLWQLWAIFVVCCLLSAVFIFSIMKRLETVTK